MSEGEPAKHLKECIREGGKPNGAASQQPKERGFPIAKRDTSHMSAAKKLKEMSDQGRNPVLDSQPQ